MSPHTSGNISIVQDWFGTTASGDSGLTIPLAVSRVERATATAAGTNGKYVRVKDGLGNTLLTGLCGTDFAAGANAAAYAANIAAWVSAHLAAINALSAGLGATAPMVVGGIGAGDYLYTGQYSGKGYYGAVIAGDQVFVIWEDTGAGLQWDIFNVDTATILNSSPDDTAFPSQASWTGSTVTAPSFDTAFDLGAFANAYVFETDDPALSFADVQSGGDAIQTGNAVVAAISFDNTGDPTDYDVAPHLLEGGAEVLDDDIFDHRFDLVGANIRSVTGAAGGETSLAYSLIPAVRTSVQVIEVSGLADAPPEDAQSGSGTGTTASLSAPIAPDSAKNFLTFSVAADVDISGATAPVGWTETSPPGGIGGDAVYMRTFTLIQAAPTSQNPTMAIPSAGWTAVAAAFGG